MGVGGRMNPFAEVLRTRCPRQPLVSGWRGHQWKLCSSLVLWPQGLLEVEATAASSLQKGSIEKSGQRQEQKSGPRKTGLA